MSAPTMEGSNSMFELLPPDVMSKVLGYVNVAARVKVAQGSKTLRKIVFQDCTALWIDIHFRNDEKRHAANLTDDLLAGLFQRVHAYNVTTSVSIATCHLIKGDALEPLRYSQVLEEVDLQRKCEDIEDESIAVDILGTMVSFKLSKVHLPRPIPRLSETELALLRQLHVAKQQRDLARNSKCTSCSGSLVHDMSKQVVANVAGPPAICCSTCNGSFCRNTTCVGMKDCMKCSGAFCDDCDETDDCSLCARSYCMDCNGIAWCDTCGKSYCRDCQNVGLHDCMKCSDAFCEDCDETARCTLCAHSYCMDCNGIAWCDTCGKLYCRDCQNIPFCCVCQWSVCKECILTGQGRSIFQCTDCQALLCTNCCSMKTCSSYFCGRPLCEYCADDHYQHCWKCEKSFCAGCRETSLVWLDCCECLRCLECVSSKKCDGCSKHFCRVEVKVCSSCDKSFCDTCRDDGEIHCVGKEKTPCKECGDECGDDGEKPAKKAKTQSK